MNQSLLTLLNPLQTLEASERERRLKLVAEQFPVQWDAVRFMLHEGEAKLAIRYLKQLCNPVLYEAGELLDLAMREWQYERQKEMAQANAPQNKINISNAKQSEQTFEKDSKAIVFNL